MARKPADNDPDDKQDLQEVEVTPSAADTAKFRALVKQKIAAGLPREDAEEVAKRQIEHDKALEASKPVSVAN
ncbi:MAG TPA: hypothetical protein VK970_10675 [Candidatus Methylacidiphilales bacterium]|nr:hypothetical protein [Candidatus Methylacidiphilales bacterium]